ncbi:MAG: hypothetical protein ABIE84_00385 [bacterium]
MAGQITIYVNPGDRRAVPVTKKTATTAAKVMARTKGTFSPGGTLYNGHVPVRTAGLRAANISHVEVPKDSPDSAWKNLSIAFRLAADSQGDVAAFSLALKEAGITDIAVKDAQARPTRKAARTPAPKRQAPKVESKKESPIYGKYKLTAGDIARPATAFIAATGSALALVLIPLTLPTILYATIGLGLVAGFMSIAKTIETAQNHNCSGVKINTKELADPTIENEAKLRAAIANLNFGRQIEVRIKRSIFGGRELLFEAGKEGKVALETAIRNAFDEASFYWDYRETFGSSATLKAMVRREVGDGWNRGISHETLISFKMIVTRAN